MTPLFLTKMLLLSLAVGLSLEFVCLAYVVVILVCDAVMLIRDAGFKRARLDAAA